MYYLDDVCAVLVGVLLCVAGAWDLRRGRVPAQLSAATLLAATADALLSPSVTTALLGLAVAAPFLVAWLWLPSMAGGADLKLTAAAGLASGWPTAAAVAIVAMATLLVVLAWAQLRHRPAPTVYCLSLAIAYVLVTL